MNFFKKLFSSNKEETANETNSHIDNEKIDITKNTSNKENEVKTIYTEEYFAKRYTENNLNENSVLDGSLKMIESYFLDNNIEPKIKSPIEHPNTLDQTISEGLGFHMYCNSFQFEDNAIIMFLAMAMSNFYVSQLEFKLYNDNEPEFPLRGMTLKYNKNGAVLSLYPYEYSLKVLNNEATFTELFDKIKSHLESMPNVETVLKNYTENLEE
ncbi:hypothetical protein QWY90_03820 [Flavobacterium paronense]|uniref:Uncharacterized protein n=1 Tax=Flavobacterium paronense TaxID=1392775 RepID=A0ABV5GHN7_9FLAO|nr:hypothetical protein [Flavobacterium paronense]MDN3676432.1 hypothetical protein [Flavobacterium paronense]